MLSQLQQLTWLDPWKLLNLPESGQHFAEELRRETNPRHVLYGAKVQAVATGDLDEVLFIVDGDRPRLAVVHLTYSGHPDLHDEFPHTLLYESVEAFERSMKDEHKGRMA